METAVELEKFSGPLDLLLQLIEKKELDITEIALAEVTEQFLAYLDTIEESRPQELADFLVVATKLLLIKSHALLPFLMPEEEEDPGELAAQLKMYKKYVDAMEHLEALLGKNMPLYAQKPMKKKPQEIVYAPPKGVGTQELRAYFIDVLKTLEPVVRIPKAAMKKVVTLREKFVQIQKVLEKQVTVNFNQLLADSEDRGEVVVTFLAVLELVKQQTVFVHQESHCAEITLEKL